MTHLATGLCVVALLACLAAAAATVFAADLHDEQTMTTPDLAELRRLLDVDEALS